MSHIATVDIEIKDLGALDEACKRIGLEFMADQHEFRWEGRSDSCSHAIRDPANASDREQIGLSPRSDGKPGWTLKFGAFATIRGGKLSKAGQNCNHLKQAYATIAATRQAMRQGYRVTEVPQKNGSIQLVCSK